MTSDLSESFDVEPFGDSLIPWALWFFGPSIAFWLLIDRFEARLSAVPIILGAAIAGTFFGIQFLRKKIGGGRISEATRIDAQLFFIMTLILQLKCSALQYRDMEELRSKVAIETNFIELEKVTG